jgi:hypothetical protein
VAVALQPVRVVWWRRLFSTYGAISANHSEVLLSGSTPLVIPFSSIRRIKPIGGPFSCAIEFVTTDGASRKFWGFRRRDTIEFTDTVIRDIRIAHVLRLRAEALRLSERLLQISRYESDVQLTIQYAVEAAVNRIEAIYDGAH